MSVYYTISKDRGIKTKEGKFVQAVSYRTITDEQLVKMIEDESTVSHIDWAAVMASFTKCIIRALNDGNRVHINGLGSFSISIQGDVYQDKSGHDRAQNLKVKGVNFLPDKEIKNGFKLTEFKHVRAVDYTTSVNDELLQSTIESLLQNQDYFTPKDFIQELGVCNTTGYKLLSKLETQGTIENKGRGREKIYSRP